MTSTQQTAQADETVRRGQAQGGFEAAGEDLPERPKDLSRPSWKALKRTLREFTDDGGIDLAAALTYYAVLSLFPAILALTSLLGVFGQGQSTTQALLDVVRDLGVTSDQIKPIKTYLDSMQGSEGAGLALVLGLLGALYAASNYVNAFARAMNRVYEVEEGRPIWKLKPQMLLITVLVLLMVALLGLSLVFTGGIAETVGSIIGLGDTAVLVWGIAKWPVMLLIAIGVVALLYWGTPNVKQSKFRWLSAGAVLAIVVCIVTTAGFAFYVANFGNYNATYGALAGFIVLLLWIWLMNVSLVLGAEFDSELERGRELQGGLPAEETIQLPPRDTRQSEKKAEKQRELLAQSRRIRMTAARRRD